MRFIDELIPNNIKDLTIFINRNINNRDIYRKYIMQFHNDWVKNKTEDMFNNDKNYLWGSEVLVPGYCELEDVFSDRQYIYVVKFFKENNLRLVSDLKEEDLLELMNYTAIGYLRFINVLYILFLVQYKDSHYLSKIDKDPINIIEEFNENEDIKDMGDVAVLVADGSEIDNEITSNRNDTSYNPMNDIDLDDSFSSVIAYDSEVEDLFAFSDSLKQSIEKGHDIVLKVRDSYNFLFKNSSILLSENLDLKKQIERINLEREVEIKSFQEKIDSMVKEKEELILVLEREFEDYRVDKSTEIDELERKIDQTNKSYEDSVRTLNISYENLKLEKESEITALKQELSQIKVEREEDKKVLDEFENMIKIMDKIKGIFRRD